MEIDSTVTKKEAPPFLERAGLSFLTASFAFFTGLILLFVPLIGWIIGPIVMIASLFTLGNMFSAKPSYVGNCPYCGCSVDAGNPGTVTKCLMCKNRFVHRDGQLWKIEK